MRHPLALLALLLTLRSLANAAELPIRKVILYKHGIGYFERGGEIPAGSSARLDFKAEEMNDVLKSLTVSDQTGNSVAGVRYDSSLPLAQKLNEFPFKLGDRSPITDFLDQIKGAEIELRFGSTSSKGQVIGARLSQSKDKPQTTTETVNVLLASGDIASFDLNTATYIRLTDPELQRQLAEYLRSLNSSRSRDQKSVYVDSARDAARKLSVAYTIPMPVWKSSYRLVLDSGAQKKPMLEGWAIIDNTTNEDWTRVDLSVISGRPISFISQLYEPKFAQRIEAELEEEQPLAPPVYKAAMAPPPPARPEMAGKPGFDRFGRIGSSTETVEVASEPLSLSSVAADTQTREAGELFEYKFSQPVTVKRNESAMLPFVQQEISARKLLIYTHGSEREHPLNSAELTNSTGKTLDGGPLSVYDGGVYAGEALVNTFKAGDKRLLSYAQDLGTRVTEDLDSGKERRLQNVSAARGVLNTRYVSEVTRTYRITNVDKKPKTLVIEHPILPDYTLLSAKPAEQTKTHYRFEVKLTGEAAQTLQVKEQRVDSERVLISTFGEDTLEYYRSNSALSAAAKQTLGEIATLRRQLSDSANQIKSLNQQVSEANANSERIRRNLGSLNSVSGQQERVQKYAADLAALDQQITTLGTQIAAETKKRDALQSQLNLKIESATF